MLDTGAEIIESVLSALKTPCKVTETIQGPQLTRYALEPAQGVSVRAFPKHARDLAYELEAESVSITAPLPGRRAIGVDVPRADRQTVLLGDVWNATQDPMTIALGLDTRGDPVLCHIPDCPHLLVGGTTNAGKSVLLHAIICSLLMRHTPDELMLLTIDTKRVELNRYEGIPHLLDSNDDTSQAVYALNALCDLMEDRYIVASSLGARTLDEMNDALRERGEETYPRIVVVVDELADLVTASKYDVEQSIVRIAQKARAVGINLIMATQSPRVQVVSGLIKANLPSRIGLTTASALDSRVLLDRNGCEMLLGRGDAIYNPITDTAPTRMQSALVTSEEIAAIADHWRSQAVTQEMATA